jgi:hypothetical protein
MKPRHFSGPETAGDLQRGLVGRGLQFVCQPKAADPGQGTLRQGLHQPAITQGRPHLRGRTREEPLQVPSARPRGACLRPSGCGGSTRCAIAVWPRTPRARTWRPGQHLPHAKNTVWTSSPIAHIERAMARGGAEKAWASSATRAAFALQHSECREIEPPAQGRYWMASRGYLFSVALVRSGRTP